MCGIAGILRLEPTSASIERSTLEAMADALQHRGPDDAAYSIDPAGTCGLAFRRLAIIDLATGQQPIGNSAGDIQLVFNGEIYNFRALRDELRAGGAVFRTSGDAEVIVHAYERWGDACLPRLFGMFAFALWDARRNRLLLARDRFGKKPLHYVVHEGRLLFASEIKALLAAGAPRRIDPHALHDYLVLQYVPAPRSVFAGFRKTPPGCSVAVEHGRVHAAAPYWQAPPPHSHATPMDWPTWRDELDQRLTSAVERRLISDVPLGAFLSGGVDSSLVVALMRRLGVSPLRTFSIGFTDPRYDESRWARLVATHFQTEHYEQIVTPHGGDMLDRLAYHYDEPFADSSAIPTYYVARYAREHVTVALTGDGGDEAFAGYDRYRAAMLAGRLDRTPRVLRQVASRLFAHLPGGPQRSWRQRMRRFAEVMAADPATRYLAWVNVFAPRDLACAYRPEFAAQLDEAFENPRRWLAGLMADAGPDAAAADRAAYADIRSYLPYDLLTKVDIASMACSLECRSPLLDHELVEFALRLPLSQRLGKAALKRYAADLLPAAILKRPKTGFGVPIGAWLRNELRERVEDALFAPDSLCTSLFDRGWLRRLVDDHIAGRQRNDHRLWSLLMLELWRRRWGAAL